MRSTIARRLEVLLAAFEKRHGRFKRVKLPGGEISDYRMKNQPRIKTISPWDVAEYLYGDSDVA